jgi:hypothetical protein
MFFYQANNRVDSACRAKPARIPSSTAPRFSTGKTPGKPKQRSPTVVLARLSRAIVINTDKQLSFCQQLYMTLNSDCW